MKSPDAKRLMWLVIAALFVGGNGCSIPQGQRTPDPASPRQATMVGNTLAPEQRIIPTPVPTGFKEGKMEVRAMLGEARFSTGEEWRPLTIGTVLRPGAVVEVGPPTPGFSVARVDFYLGDNGPVVRLMENSIMSVELLAYRRRHSNTTINTVLELREGKMLANVRKLHPDSDYRVKTAAGFIKVRGTDFVLCSNGKVGVVSGSVGVMQEKDGAELLISSGEFFDPKTREVLPWDSTSTASHQRASSPRSYPTRFYHPDSGLDRTKPQFLNPPFSAPPAPPPFICGGCVGPSWDLSCD